MGVPRDLDEYSEDQLVVELSRRRASRKAGLCDYCGRASSTPPCKFPSRHAASFRRKTPKKLEGKIIHACRRGRAPCENVVGAPWQWPAGHSWSSRREELTCQDCIAIRAREDVLKGAVHG